MEKKELYSKILSRLKDAKIQYAYDKSRDIYSVKATIEGKERVITLIVGKQSMELDLMDTEGNLLERIAQDGSKIAMYPPRSS